ncbi:hypothetical protein ACFYWY_27550 [Streptomyces sp. NPDC002870]|uniref:hypothetical protein n=1 Tax=Streptomyces sp. NPDC002870 TaxID=3364666 RepID=UPI003688D84E
MTTAPWSKPSTRKKPLVERRAERQARRAEHWGDRIAEARKQGPRTQAATAWDRLRATVNRLPEGLQREAWEMATAQLDRIRQEFADSDSE